MQKFDFLVLAAVFTSPVGLRAHGPADGPPRAESPAPPSATAADAWAAYREADLAEATRLFTAVSKADPDDAEALMGLFLLSGTVAEAPEALDLAERIAALEELPTAFVAAFRYNLTGGNVVAKQDRKRVSRLYRALAEHPGMPPAQRAALAGNRCMFDYVSGSPESALRDLAEASPSITEWSFVGGFRNTLGSGFDVEHGPLAEPGADATFANEYGAPISWRPLRNNLSGVDVEFGHYLDKSDAVAYAQTFVTVPAAGDYRLALGLGGSAKVWVDDALVYSESEERDCGTDHLHVDLPLSAGNHRILLQLGAAERNEMSYIARLLRPDGSPVEGLRASGAELSYTPDPALAERAEVGYERAFELAREAAERPGASFMDRVTFARLLISHGRYEEAREAVNDLVEIAPLAPYVVELQLALFNVEGDEAGVTDLVARVRDARPGDARSILARYEEAVAAEDLAEAAREVEALRALHGPTEQVLTLEMGLAFQREDIEEGLALLSEARDEFPTSTTLLWIDHNLQADGFNQPLVARRLVSNWLDEYNVASVANQLAGHYRADGNQRMALRRYREILDVLPFDPDVRLAVVYTLIDDREYEDALEEVEVLLAQAPDASAIHETHGDVLKLLDREREAAAAFGRALELDPNDFSLRTSLRELNGEAPAFTLLDSVDVDEVIATYGGTFADADKPFAMLADDKRRVIYEDGVSESRSTYVYEVLNERGIERLKEYSIGGTIYEAQIVKPDGRRVDGERNGSTIVFPRLAVGDFVHVSVGSRDYHYGKLLGHVWDDYFLNAWFPVGRTRYQILAPAEYTFDYETRGAEVEPVIGRAEGGLKTYTWAVERPPLIRDEELMPASADVSQRLVISSLPDWQFVVDWYRELSESRTEGDYAVTRKVAELFPDGYEHLTEAERVDRIYAFVANDIAYSSLSFRQSAHVPQRAGKTLATQLGDCKDVSSLFVAMAREVGVGAHLVLVDTRDNGETDLTLPSINFNHCIARLDDTGEYLELTDQYLPRGAVSRELAESIALPIDGRREGAELTSVSAGPLGNGMLADTDVRFDGDDVVVERRGEYYGAYAARRRHRYRDEAAKEQEDYLRAAIEPRVDRPFAIEHFGFRQLDELTDTVGVDYAIRVDGAVTKVAGMRLFALPWSMSHTDVGFVSQPERDYDLCLWKFSRADLKHEVIRTHLPAGVTLLEMPTDVHLEVDGLSYDLTFRMEGDVLVAERRYEMKRDTFGVEEFAGVQELFKQIAEADEQLLGLSKKA